MIWLGWTRNPAGKVAERINMRPGWTSLIRASAPGTCKALAVSSRGFFPPGGTPGSAAGVPPAATVGSDKTNGLAPLLRTVTLNSIFGPSGAAGNVMVEGVAVTAG